MLPTPDAVTSVSVPHQSSTDSNRTESSAVTQATPPVFALKELVASLYREQNKIQNLLSSLGFALRSFNNLNQFLELVPLMAARVADADGSALIQFKSNGQVRLEQIYCQEGQDCQALRQGFEQAIRKVRVSLANSSPEKQDVKTKPVSNTPGSKDKNVVRKAKPVKIIEAFLDEQVKQHLGSEVQLFSIQILAKNTARGRLYVFSRNSKYTWTSTRQKLVQLVADQTAVAIANNELTAELRKKERLDRELAIASEIQLHLLPHQCPQIDGIELAAYCKTANRVGGDYYDFIPTNYDKQHPGSNAEAQANTVPWSIVIGDVMGKGVPAGLIMTMTRGMLRAEVLNRHSPAQILQHLNRVMYADLENSHRFVTLFYSEYCPQTKILTYSNAAHNPPILWRASNRSIERLDTQGMLIGLDANSSYEDDQVELTPGDTIIYYTDGFTDAANQNGDRFDEENLINAIKWACQHCDDAQAILDYLFDQVQQFIGLDHRNGDDMTLVAMRVNSSD